MKLGRNINDVQRSNRCLVFDTLLRESPISRVDLSRFTGLNKATITNIIQDYIARGIAEDVGSINSSNGRKVAGVSLLKEKISSIIVRIQANQLIFTICNLQNEFSSMRVVPYQSNTEKPDLVEQLLIENIRELLTICGKQKQKLLGVSVATLGWLFRKNGNYTIKADIAPVLSKIDLKTLFEKYFPEQELYIEHDAKVSALAEWDYFCKKEYTPTSMLNIVGDIGFGGGIVIEGKVFSGFNGIAGEVGHLGIDPNNGSFFQKNGRIHYSGLFENYASPLALKKRIVENLPEFPDSVISENSSIYEIYEAYEQGDNLAEFCIQKMARYLAYGLTSIIFILNPEIIVFGDKMIRSEKFYTKLKKYLAMFLPEELIRETKIRVSDYQDKGVLLGANIALIKHFIQTKKLLDFLNREFQ